MRAQLPHGSMEATVEPPIMSSMNANFFPIHMVIYFQFYPFYQLISKTFQPITRILLFLCYVNNINVFANFRKEQQRRVWMLTPSLTGHGKCKALMVEQLQYHSFLLQHHQDSLLRQHLHHQLLPLHFIFRTHHFSSTTFHHHSPTTHPISTAGAEETSTR